MDVKAKLHAKRKEEEAADKVLYEETVRSLTVTGAPYREVNSRVATATNT